MTELQAKDVQRDRRRVVRRYVLAILIVLVCIVGFFIYAGFASLAAEERLQTTLYTIRLVDLFVQSHGRWPSSWRELQTVKVPAKLVTTTYSEGQEMYRWPESSEYFQRYVIIDFNADPNVVAQQSTDDFIAIRPNGTHYPYKEYHFIEDLQQTLRQKGFGQGKK
jgi:hypothetical protein